MQYNATEPNLKKKTLIIIIYIVQNFNNKFSIFFKINQNQNWKLGSAAL